MLLLLTIISILCFFTVKKYKNLFSKRILFAMILAIITLIFLRAGLVSIAGITSIIVTYLLSPNMIKRFFSNRQETVFAQSKNNILSRDEAADILGISNEAKPEEIKLAYRKLMQKLHPDVGGNTYFANKINDAYETLIK